MKWILFVMTCIITCAVFFEIGMQYGDYKSADEAINLRVAKALETIASPAYDLHEYQIEVVMDTIEVYDLNRLVSKYIITDSTTHEQFNNIIAEDNL